MIDWRQRLHGWEKSIALTVQVVAAPLMGGVRLEYGSGRRARSE